MPGRSNRQTNWSPVRKTSIGISAGVRAAPNTSAASRSKSRNGSKRSDMINTPPGCSGIVAQPTHISYTGDGRFQAFSAKPGSVEAAQHQHALAVGVDGVVRLDGA